MSFSWALAGANRSSTTAPPSSPGTGWTRQLPSLTALVGDASDNLPKIPGVGTRTAQKLVQRFGDIRKLIEGLEHVTPAALRGTLAAASAQLLETSRWPARDDVPLPSGARAAPVGAEAWSRMRALFVEWEFDSLLTRIDQLARPEPPSPEGMLATATK